VFPAKKRMIFAFSPENINDQIRRILMIPPRRGISIGNMCRKKINRSAEIRPASHIRSGMPKTTLRTPVQVHIIGANTTALLFNDAFVSQIHLNTDCGIGMTTAAFTNF
jgi:hypothetical protein